PEPPSATVAPSGYEALEKTAPITVSFDQSMDPSSIVLSGDLAEHVGELTWGATSSSDDTLVIHPVSDWPRGEGLHLTVEGSSAAGVPMEAYTAVLYVPLEFDNGQLASVVIGQANME